MRATALDFELLFAALPAPHATLAADGTVLALNVAMTALLGPAPTLVGQPLAALLGTLAAAGHTLAPTAAWTAGLLAVQTGSTQVLALEWSDELFLVAPSTPTPYYWKATLQPVPAPATGALRYVLVGLFDVGNELRFQHILNQVPLTISITEGPEHRFTFLSKKARVMMGPQAAVGRTMAESLPDAVAQGYTKALSRVREDGQPWFGHETRTDLLDPTTGEMRPYYHNVGYLPLPGAQGLGVLAYSLDVTEQVQARLHNDTLLAAALTGDQRLRRVAESLPTITYISDQEGQVLYISPQWYAFTGTALTDDLSYSWTACLHPDDSLRVASLYAAALAAGSPWRYELRLRRHDGEYRWFVSQGVPEPLAEAQAAGRARQWFGSNLDMHELHDARHRLEAKDQQLSQILSQSPALIATLEGPEHRFAFTNPGYDALVEHRAQLGLTAAECLPEMVEQGFISLLDTVYHTGETFAGSEMAIQFESATSNPCQRVYLDVTYQALRDGRGQVTSILAFAVDVTKRVLARREAEMLAAEMARRDEQVRVITASVPVFIFNFNIGGAITYTNPYFYEYTGLDPAAPLDDAWNALPPDDRAAVSAVAQTAMAAGTAWQAAFRCRRHDGELRWFQTKVQPYTDAAGKLAGFSAATVEIHELHKRTEELARSRTDFAALADNMAQLAWMADERGHIFWYNQQWYDYTGSTLAEMQGKGWQKMHAPELVEDVNERYLASIRAGQPWEDTFPLRRHDGEFRWFLSRARPIRHEVTGQVVRWFGTNTDVTELRQLQEQVLASQARFQQLLETLPQMAWTARPDGTINYYNQRWYDFTGSTFTDLQDWSWEQFMHPDDLATTLRRWQHSLTTGAAFESEHRWRDRHGNYRWFLARGEAIRDDNGDVALWVGANTDVHDFKQVQQQLEAQNARLTRTNEDLDNFAYAASHDLKQPIHNMAGIFEELTRTAYFRDPDAIKLITYFERALEQIFRTIDDLSAIVQEQRKEQERPAEDVELAPLVDEIIDSLQDLVTQSGATFELDFVTSPVVPFVRLNLQRLFFTLISNALKYAAPGRPPRIRLSSTPGTAIGRPMLIVQDNGLGIDLERFGTQLFQLFRRFHGHVEGTGMGLYLVNRIVQSHGGQLKVSSTVGEGTTFTIYL